MPPRYDQSVGRERQWKSPFIYDFPIGPNRRRLIAAQTALINHPLCRDRYHFKSDRVTTERYMGDDNHVHVMSYMPTSTQIVTVTLKWSPRQLDRWEEETVIRQIIVDYTTRAQYAINRPNGSYVYRERARINQHATSDDFSCLSRMTINQSVQVLRIAINQRTPNQWGHSINHRQSACVPPRGADTTQRKTTMTKRATLSGGQPCHLSKPDQHFDDRG